MEDIPVNSDQITVIDAQIAERTARITRLVAAGASQRLIDQLKSEIEEIKQHNTHLEDQVDGDGGEGKGEGGSDVEEHKEHKDSNLFLRF